MKTASITEAKNKQDAEFQMEGMFKALNSGPMTPSAIGQRLIAAVRQHAQPPGFGSGPLRLLVPPARCCGRHALASTRGQERGSVSQPFAPEDVTNDATDIGSRTADA